MDLDEARAHVRQHFSAVLSTSGATAPSRRARWARPSTTPAASSCRAGRRRSRPAPCGVDVLSLPDALEPLVDDDRRAVLAEQRCLLRTTLLHAGPDRAA